tara:strand:- start:4728 stop:5501 length:774 start_codon:yes stop_codon:yes gene_type:complete
MGCVKGRECKCCGEWFNFSYGEKKLHGKKVKFLYTSQKYCTKDCYKEAMRSIQSRWYRPIAEKVEGVCKADGCTNTFVTTKGRAERGYKPKQFCSSKCRDKSWKDSNPEKVKEYRKKTAINYKTNETMRIGRNRYQRNLRRNNPSYAIRDRLCKIIRASLKRSGMNPGKKVRSSTEELTGCTFEKLTHHIESQFTGGMNWDVFLNGGRSGIHIDHIKPCASFDLTKEEEQKKCFHYTNLQPLWGRDNQRKGSKVLLK